MRPNIACCILSGCLLCIPQLASESSEPEVPSDAFPIRGADISMLARIEECGGRYFDESGTEKDLLLILKEHGVNWIRLRLWNDPRDALGRPVGGGNNSLERTVELARRAKALGFHLLLDLHYSDFWADPGWQKKPAAWEALDPAGLRTAVYEWTARAIRTLDEAGACPDMVQVGNEVSNGMLWPDGQLHSGDASVTAGGFDGFAALFSEGVRAVRDTDPRRSGTRILVAVHLADGANNAVNRWVLDGLAARGADYDIIGLSYYPWWNGPVSALRSNLRDLAGRYGKGLVVLETASPWTSRNGDGMTNVAPGEGATVRSQEKAIRAVFAAVASVPDGKGLGAFYWEPGWIPVSGAGWKTGEGNGWDNCAMFDFSGKALPSLSVFAADAGK